MNSRREPRSSRLQRLRAHFGLDGFDVLKLLLWFLLIYVPYQRFFPTTLGFAGLNVLNLLLVGTFVAVVAAGATGWPAPLTVRIPFFWLTVFVAFLIGQTHRNADPFADSVNLKTIITYMLLYFLYYYGVRDVRTVRLLVCTILFATFVASAEVMHQAIDYGLDNYNYTHRASGPFGADWQNSNRAGVFFAIFVPQLLAVSFFRRIGFTARLIFFGAFVLGVFATFYTYSRQSYVCLALSVMILALRRNVLLAVLFGVALYFGELWLPAPVMERVQSTQSVDETGEAQLDESTESRPILWAGAIEIMQRHPLGIGLGRFQDEIGSYTIYEHRDAHNQYLLVGAEAGLQGLIALLALLLGFLFVAVRLAWAAETDEDRTLAWLYVTSVVGVVTGSFYGSPMFMGEVMGNFWALSGIVAKYYRIRFHSEPASAE